MVSVSPYKNAMTFDLYVQSKKTLDARDLLNSQEIGFFPPQIQAAVTQALTTDEKLTKEYQQNYKALVEEYGKPKDEADEVALHAGALFATIITNREKFPPQSFSIQIDIGHGQTKTLEIKDASMYAGITFKRQQIERLEKYMDEVKAKSAQTALDNSHSVSPALGVLGKMLSIISMQKAEGEAAKTAENGEVGDTGKSKTDQNPKAAPDLKMEEQTLVQFVRDFAKIVREAYQEA